MLRYILDSEKNYYAPNYHISISQAISFLSRLPPNPIYNELVADILQRIDIILLKQQRNQEVCDLVKLINTARTSGKYSSIEFPCENGRLLFAAMLDLIIKSLKEMNHQILFIDSKDDNGNIITLTTPLKYFSNSFTRTLDQSINPPVRVMREIDSLLALSYSLILDYQTVDYKKPKT